MDYATNAKVLLQPCSKVRYGYSMPLSLHPAKASRLLENSCYVGLGLHTSMGGPSGSAPLSQPAELTAIPFVPNRPRRLTTNSFQSPYSYRASGLAQIAVSALLRASSVQAREVNVAEHCRYGTRDLDLALIEVTQGITVYPLIQYSQSTRLLSRLLECPCPLAI